MQVISCMPNTCPSSRHVADVRLIDVGIYLYAAVRLNVGRFFSMVITLCSGPYPGGYLISVTPLAKKNQIE